MSPHPSPIVQNRRAWNAAGGEPDDAPSQARSVLRALAGLSLDLEGRDVLNLQCGAGHDAVALARMGARVTGLDFSSAQLGAARGLAEREGVELALVEADIHSLAAHVEAERFDCVLALGGVLCWVADLDRWAGGIRHVLKPRGSFVVYDVHPVAAILENVRGSLRPARSYFGSAGGTPRVTTWRHLRNPRGAPPPPQQITTWDWSLSAIFTALLRAGLELSEFVELPERGEIYRWAELEDDARSRVPGFFCARFTRKA